MQNFSFTFTRSPTLRATGKLQFRERQRRADSATINRRRPSDRAVNELSHDRHACVIDVRLFNCRNESGLLSDAACRSGYNLFDSVNRSRITLPGCLRIGPPRTRIKRTSGKREEGRKSRARGQELHGGEGGQGNYPACICRASVAEG